MRGEIFRWLVLVVVVVVSFGGLYYRYQQSRPCAEPLMYAVGNVDKRFGIDHTTLVAALEAAAQIWNKAAGKTVLAYDQSAAMKVNLVYDEREANAQLGSKIAREQDTLDSLRSKVDMLQSQYEAQQSAYNAEVQAINARGGASRREIEQLSDEKRILETQLSGVNAAVSAYNAAVRTLNEKVKEYNTLAGHVFEEGEYVRDASGERINIFEFIGGSQLTRVLAHEFGHAIGLDHTEDTKAIMYAQNESGNLVPTSADLSALSALCGT